MGRVSAVKHNIYLQEWAVKISECQNSGQIVVEWCKQHKFYGSVKKKIISYSKQQLSVYYIE